jgi:hypothetical protein
MAAPITSAGRFSPRGPLGIIDHELGGLAEITVPVSAAHFLCIPIYTEWLAHIASRHQSSDLLGIRQYVQD